MISYIHSTIVKKYKSTILNNTRIKSEGRNIDQSSYGLNIQPCTASDIILTELTEDKKNQKKTKHIWCCNFRSWLGICTNIWRCHTS